MDVSISIDNEFFVTFQITHQKRILAVFSFASIYTGKIKYSHKFIGDKKSLCAPLLSLKARGSAVYFRINRPDSYVVEADFIAPAIAENIQ